MKDIMRDGHPYRADGRPIAQWARLKAGRSDDLGTGQKPGAQGGSGHACH